MCCLLPLRVRRQAAKPTLGGTSPLITRKSSFLVSATAAAALGLALITGVSAQVQLPGHAAPTGAALQTATTICASTQADLQFEGSQQLFFGDLAFVLPDGRYVVARVAYEDSAHIEICHVKDGSILVLDPVSGKELQRDVKSDDAEAAFDALLRSVRTTGVCLADCGDRSRIAPPDAGDAGLAAR